MEISLIGALAELAPPDLLAAPYGGSLSPLLEGLDGPLPKLFVELAASKDASAKAGSAAVFHLSEGEQLGAARIGLFGVGGPGELDEDSLRTAAGTALRSVRGRGGTVVWIFDPGLGISPERQLRAVVEGALLGDHDGARWKTSEPVSHAERLVIVGAPEGLAGAAGRAEVVSRWTNHARELVDAPPNEITPAKLARAATELLAGLPVEVEVIGRDALAASGLRALLFVGQGSVNEPCQLVLRYRGSSGGGDVLGLVGKGVTFDSGGFFLKSQDDIVRQKADMGGAAAVIGAVGAVAELGLPLELLAVIPAAENMIGGNAYRPGDIYETASGLTVEITNPDAEGRLLLADGLWYAQKHGATHLVDVATLTGAMRSGMGDLYTGVFSNRDDWRARVVAAGDESGDHAWPWPLHRRYRRLLDSRLADLRHTAGKSFGYPIVAAAFLQCFVGELPWAHIDIHSTAFLDELRDYLGPGATGAGVRLLTQLAADMS